jgi:hypothetical protein
MVPQGGREASGGGQAAGIGEWGLASEAKADGLRLAAYGVRFTVHGVRLWKRKRLPSPIVPRELAPRPRAPDTQGIVPHSALHSDWATSAASVPFEPERETSCREAQHT